MQQELSILLITAASIGFFHTLMGPDHYVPFIVVSKARNWSFTKTISITLICAVFHVLSSVVLGLIGISFGIALNNLEFFEATRGEIAAWLLTLFGLGYMIWGIYRHKKHKKHIHMHSKHKKPKQWKELTPWLLFIIFLFGPCEPLIPILMYPAANESIYSVILVASVFGAVTTITMLSIVTISYYGIKLFPISLEKYIHPIAGGSILLCGLAILFLGL